jgi:hypothetical protein
LAIPGAPAARSTGARPHPRDDADAVVARGVRRPTAGRRRGTVHAAEAGGVKVTRRHRGGEEHDEHLAKLELWGEGLGWGGAGDGLLLLGVDWGIAD